MICFSNVLFIRILMYRVSVKTYHQYFGRHYLDVRSFTRRATLDEAVTISTVVYPTLGRPTGIGFVDG